MTGSMCTLYRLHEQIDSAVLLSDGGISTVGQGTATTVAQASNIVFVSAEVQCLGLGFEATVVVIDDLQKMPMSSSVTRNDLTY